MGDISKNFSLKEFTHSNYAKRYGINNQINDETILKNITALVNNILQPLRDNLKKEIKINSGYRCAELNKKVGGVPNSQHTKGEAADIFTGSPENSYHVAQAIINLFLPFDQLILYPTFIHVSHNRTVNREQLLYNKTYQYKKL